MTNHAALTTDLDYRYDGLETLIDFIRWGARLFTQAGLVFGHGTDNPFDEALMLTCYQLNLPVSRLDHYLNARLTLAEREDLVALYKQRIETRQPAAYLIGQARFAGLDFYVNQHTLVPRSPIAELIEKGFQGWVNPDEVTRVLDLCTGSGCIGIASLQAFDFAQVDLVDISPEALAVAQKNVARYQLEDRVRVIEADLFAGVQGQRYDVILSNPPYVDAIEMTALPLEYQAEPALGLAAGTDGLDIVRRILAQAADHLTDEGVLIVEVGVSQHFVEQVYEGLPLYWFDFDQGGEGVFAVSREELVMFDALVQNRLAD